MDVYYQKAGEGKPIIYLHGWGCSGDIFLPTVRYLPDYCNYLIDFPGFGKSSPPPESGWNVFDYANRLIAFTEELNLDGATVVGHSFGCRVAMATAYVRPELVERLLLVAPAGLRRFSLKRWSKELLYKARKRFGKNTKAYGSDDYRNCSETMKNTFVNVVNQDLSAYAKVIKQPTLIVCGRQDTATPLKDARKLHKYIVNSSLAEVDGDHFAMFYAPKAFAKTIRLFTEERL
ncbi:MAG: alpha/beta hydrolase [Firmicutes bacterium]|nr:alpha/beta hydrolase [Bacillota bacterium]